MPHFLVVNVKGEDWEIEHEEDCPMIDMWDGPDGKPIMEYACLVGHIVSNVGIDDHLTFVDGMGWRDLEPGRYEIKTWEAHYSPIPGIRGSEYEAGIEFVNADYRKETP